MGVWKDLLGTSKSFFQLGFSGPKLKDAGGGLAVRNAGDTADAAVTVSRLDVSGDVMMLNSDAAAAGADWSYTLQRPALGMAGAVSLTLPPADGSPNQVLATDGNGVLSWADAGTTASSIKADTTTIGFGSAATVSAFTLPAGNIVDYVDLVVDQAFDGAPSLSLGIAGQASKYLSATDADLTQAAGTMFRIHPGKPAAGGDEALQISFAAGGATAGSARVIVHYALPA